ncbi:CBS domain-containing protein [Alkalithermobacter thermoalcaliphilus JW-YL-7 = DSM 7308]|uniref:CBS domain containing membrane protein n=1 Tax=Alkalithermobacter thermoalcaliphilus JW-YL-7 = DSM 7308 TaxID=1121328 RepID=A0A150FQ58_CLOPD|nr:CBS domain containing membrane protein [[Clostridium] paradoxum JW-YL-7 = DSM 7308]SHK63989.1 CBS domain-containing protein [[Clostridium] paradoxum JW-YL-7 = DSM 7308]
MNIAFFLTPKKDVICLTPNSTMRQALEKMEYHRYTAVPIIDEEGRYVGTITEGDLLWMLKNTPDLNFKNTSKILLKDIPRHMDNKPVSINSNIEDLISVSVNQNFVPVIDDQNVFIGIIKRSDIINYCYKAMFKCIEANNT